MREKYYKSVFSKLPIGYAFHEIITNSSGKPYDLLFLEVNEACEKLFGIKRDALIGSSFRNIFANIAEWIEFYEKVFSNIDTKVFEHFFETQKKWFSIYPHKHNNKFLSLIIVDISDVKLLESYHESEIKYRQIFENANDAIFLMSGDKFIDCNNKTLEIFQCKQSDIIGAEPYRFSPEKQPDGCNSMKKALEKIQAALNGIPQRFEWTHIKLDGTPFDAEVSLSAFERPNGEKWVQAIVRNISEQKRIEASLRESEAKYKNLFDTMPTGFYRSTPEGYFVDANPAYVKMLGYTSLEELKSIYIPKDIYVHESEREEIVSDNPTFISELEVYRLKRKDGQIIWIEDNSRYTTDESGKIIFHEGICRDITDRKNADKERALKEKLEKKIILAEETLKFKQNFLANMSHEMRTPLTGILGMAEILNKTDLNEEQRNYLNIILQSGDNLREIINNVLDFSKIEAGQVALKYRVFELQTILSNAESLFFSICKKDIAFKSYIDDEIPQYIKADEFLIIQIINNLISNAVKFTERGKITLKIEPVKEKCKSDFLKIKFLITDTGIGIRNSIKSKLFKPFAQIEEMGTRKFEGTGLGLSICKELATLHGGEIGVDSKPNVGSTFWFTIIGKKATSDEYLAVQKSSKKSSIIHNLRILLAEDNRVNQMVIKLTLNSLGHEVTLANTGKHVIEIYEPDKFDLILMDIQMPEMDGISATKILKLKHKTLPPIVGLSANAFEGDREKYMEMGMDEYLIKPLDMNDFERVINKFFP
jgi:PAS domain S-box-containing protein